MLVPDNTPVCIKTLSPPAAEAAKVMLDILRADLLHPVISGNKWYKLRYYLEAAEKKQVKMIVTFGGAWSNHIVATAAACQWKNIPCAGIIRGEAPPHLSATLQEAASYGMQLHFFSREDFRLKKIPAGLDHPDHLIIPEGGYGPDGARGAATMLDGFETEKYTHLICAVGTGTMVAGLQQRSSPHQQVIGIPVLKAGPGIEDQILPLTIKGHGQLQLIHDYHFGGYAKKTDTLIRFMNEWYDITSTPSDLVYTGKMFYAVNDLLQKEFFPAGSHILLIHSGGLQGNYSLPKGTLNY